jgi:hypothetical protein
MSIDKIDSGYATLSGSDINGLAEASSDKGSRYLVESGREQPADRLRLLNQRLAGEISADNFAPSR